MREFSNGWRRKLGVLTLVMACVFAVGWIRSPSTFVETIELVGFELDSFDGTLEVYDSNGYKPVAVQGPNGEPALTQSNDPILTVEYQFVVIPLTFLSAWLLLSKPRRIKADSLKLMPSLRF